jgi:hypothetical protein
MNLKTYQTLDDTNFKRLVNKRLPDMKRNIRFYNQIYKVYFESTKLKTIFANQEKRVIIYYILLLSVGLSSLQ